MAVKPIDMQVLLPKLHKNELMKPRIIHKQENEQQVMQNNTNRDVDDKLKKVNTYEQKEPPRIKNDEERGRRQSEQEAKGQSEDKAKKDSKDGKEPQKDTAPKRRSHIDIKV